MNQTENYSLSQWAKTDRIMMEDFNADNAKIDTALGRKLEVVELFSVTEALTNATEWQIPVDGTVLGSCFALFAELLTPDMSAGNLILYANRSQRLGEYMSYGGSMFLLPLRNLDKRAACHAGGGSFVTNSTMDILYRNITDFTIKTTTAASNPKMNGSYTLRLYALT